MMPSSTELVYFLEVSQTLNVSRAAERLGITQPTLSLAIQRLEDSIGTPLFIRTKTGVQLTRAGCRLAHQTRTIIREWEKLREEVLKDEEEIRGSYILGAHPSVSLFTLPQIIEPLMKQHEKLELKLVHGLSRKITEEVISFKIDFGIVVNAVQHPDIVIKQLWEDTVTLWTSKNGSPLQDPFSGKAVLICDPELIQTDSILKKIKKSQIKFSRIITSSNLELIASLTQTGAGIGILPSRVATNQALALTLKPLKHAPCFQDRHSLIFRADAQKSKANRSLAHEIERLLKKMN
ncbi:MAG: LysR family transcriptional regulator [Deltaproteobacteria bacterium]